MARLSAQLAALGAMSHTQLKQAWQQAYGSIAPGLSPNLLRLGIGYRLQEQKRGGLPKALEAELLAWDSKAPPLAPPATLRPGSQLVREWNGRTIMVTVVEDGFLFDGQQHASLSSIARAVTGAHWSGPRFFGIKVRG